MSQTREFHLGDVLSITTERLVSPRHIDGVYDILGFMVGAALFTHQLPRVRDECAPELIRQHPWLNEIDTEGVNAENWREWLAEQVDVHGEMVAVRQIDAAKHQHINPVDELRQIAEERR